jgi:hypothetical protein
MRAYIERDLHLSPYLLLPVDGYVHTLSALPPPPPPPPRCRCRRRNLRGRFPFHSSTSSSRTPPGGGRMSPTSPVVVERGGAAVCCVFYALLRGQSFCTNTCTLFYSVPGCLCFLLYSTSSYVEIICLLSCRQSSVALKELLQGSMRLPSKRAQQSWHIIMNGWPWFLLVTTNKTQNCNSGS